MVQLEVEGCMGSLHGSQVFNTRVWVGCFLKEKGVDLLFSSRVNVELLEPKESLAEVDGLICARV